MAVCVLLLMLDVTEFTSFRYAGQHALAQTVGNTLVLSTIDKILFQNLERI